MLANYPKVRVGIYIAAIVSQIASFFVALTSAELANAFVQTASVLSAVAGVTALTNVKSGGQAE